MKRKLALALTCSLFASQAFAVGAHWEYEGEHGPANWAGMEPAFKACGMGKRQSPINIETRDAEKVDCVLSFFLMFRARLKL